MSEKTQQSFSTSSGILVEHRAQSDPQYALIPFMDGFTLVLDPNYQSADIVVDALSSIGVLSSLAQEQSSLASIINDGGIPSRRMIVQAMQTASILHGLVAGITKILPDSSVRDMT